MLEKDNWIALAQFVQERKQDPAFVQAMRPIALVDHPGPRGGKPKRRAVIGRYLDQAFALTGYLPMHLHVWNGRETEIADWLRREKPFGETEIREYHPRKDELGKVIVPGVGGEVASSNSGMNAELAAAYAAINELAGW